MLAWVITSGVSVILVLLIRQIFKGKISLRLQYALWLLVLVRLLIPVNVIDTDISILKYMPLLQENGGFSAQNQSMDSKNHILTEIPSQNIVQGDPLGASTNITPSGQLAAGQAESLGDRIPGISQSQSGKAVQTETPLWQRILTGIWILGMAVAGAVITGVNLGFARRLRRAREAMEIREMEQPVRRKTLPVYRVPGLPSPCLFGLIHPAIYLPEGVTQEELSYVLAHEESHYRMGDHVWSLLRSLCLVLHWYHPLVWLAAYVSRQDSELACDERTIRQLGEEKRNTYGRVLLDMTVRQGSRADFLCCATTMSAEGRSLRERVLMISRRPRTLAVTGAVVAVLMLGIFCVACTGVREEDLDKTSGSLPESGKDSGALTEIDSTKNGPRGGNAEQADLLHSSGSEEENTQGGPGAGQSHVTGGEADQNPTDPSVDHVRSENSYYRVIKDTTIEDPYFTMEVPEVFVGQVAYGAVLGKNDAGESYLQHLTLFHVPTVSRLDEGEPQYGWHELADGGVLCYCFWTGLPDLESDLEEIAFRSGTWDIRGMEYILARDYDEHAGVGGRLAQANEAGTGAYFWVEPTDVQYDTRAMNEYEACLWQMERCWNSFSAKSFPYEELEGYSGDTPQWKQDLEEAEVVYSWFTSMAEVPMWEEPRSDGGFNKPYEEIGGTFYGRVDVPGVETMEDLRSYVNRYFAPEITDALLSGQKPALDDKGKPPFVEKDGVLYGLAGGVGLYQRTDAICQYAVNFVEVTETGQQRPVSIPEENGQKQIAYVSARCQCSWSLVSDSVLPTAVLSYVMERQEDGSWRVVGDYELPVSLTLEEESKYGHYRATVKGVPYLLNLDWDGTFDFVNEISSIMQLDNTEDRFHWTDDMLVLEFGDSDKVWYFQMQNGGRWNLSFRGDLSTPSEGGPLPDGTVFEKTPM